MKSIFHLYLFTFWLFPNLSPNQSNAETDPCEEKFAIFHADRALTQTTDPFFVEFMASLAPKQYVIFVAPKDPDLVQGFASRELNWQFVSPADAIFLPNETVDRIFLARSFRAMNGEQVEATLRHVFHALKKGGRAYLTFDTPNQKIFSPKDYLRYVSAVDQGAKWPGYFSESRAHTFDMNTVQRALLDAGLQIHSIDFMSYPDIDPLLRDPSDNGFDLLTAVVSKPL